MKETNKLCKGCSYANTPDNKDRCNYCGELFTDTENMTVDVTSTGYNGIMINDLDLAKLPKAFAKSKDISKFLEMLKKYGNPDSCKIWTVYKNMDSFCAILIGNSYETTHYFLKECPHLRLFNIYTDSNDYEDDGDPDNPAGYYGVSFEKND